MNHDVPAYGLSSLVIINTAVFIIFAFSFFKPKTARDWRTFGTFSAFIVALFAEMYGFPLTIYLMSGWLAQRFPGVDPLSHDFGHLWYSLLGFKGNPHLNPIHLLSNLAIAAGFILLSSAWRVLFQAQKDGQLATTGAYAHVRHPQYVAFIVIMFGFLLQWPTFVTRVMFPVLVMVYARLARREEADVRAQFGGYGTRTPAEHRLSYHDSGTLCRRRRRMRRSEALAVVALIEQCDRGATQWADTQRLSEVVDEWRRASAATFISGDAWCSLVVQEQARLPCSN